MRKKRGSDQVEASESKPESITPAAEEAKPKVRSGIFGLISIFSALILVAIAYVNPFSADGQFHLDSSTDITVNLKLTSQEFLVISDKNVCDGVGPFPGIKTSTLFVKSSSLNESQNVGSGKLNDQGACEYTITVPTTESFKGGNVDFSLKFPFGKSRVFTINVGTSAPYKPAEIEIPFD